MAEAYCLKCKEMRAITNPQVVTLKNGRQAITGTCPICGTRVNRIIKAIKELKR